MSNIDELLPHNAAYAPGYPADLPLPPARKLAVVACMDARLDVYSLLGLEVGESHVIRNAGGVVTEDVLRSLAISQNLLGTREIILIHHSDCGMLTFSDDGFRNELRERTGAKPTWAAEAFDDLHTDVRQGIERIRNSPFLIDTTQVTGFVFNVSTGHLEEVALEPVAA